MRYTSFIRGFLLLLTCGPCAWGSATSGEWLRSILNPTSYRFVCEGEALAKAPLALYGSFDPFTLQIERLVAKDCLQGGPLSDFPGLRPETPLAWTGMLCINGTKVAVDAEDSLQSLVTKLNATQNLAAQDSFTALMMGDQQGGFALQLQAQWVANLLRVDLQHLHNQGAFDPCKLIPCPSESLDKERLQALSALIILDGKTYYSCSNFIFFKRNEGDSENLFILDKAFPGKVFSVSPVTS